MKVRILLSSCVFLLFMLLAGGSFSGRDEDLYLLPFAGILLYFIVAGVGLFFAFLFYKYLIKFFFESWHKKTRLDMIAKNEVENNDFDRENAKDSAAPAQQVEQISSVSPSGVADELAKLAQLKDAGILTEEEFNAQKAKLLNS